MRTIALSGDFKEDWVRMFIHLSNLFFEETKIVKSPATGDMEVRFHEQRDGNTLVAEAVLTVEEETYRAKFQEFAEGGDEKEQNRQWKRLYSHVLLEVLESFTGMNQEWGILTGIRPTKLYHKYRQQGHSAEAVKQLLMDKHRVSAKKADLLETIADVQLNAVPDLYNVQDEVSIYIGIPFCPTKCAYCTFPAYAIHRKSGRVETFLDGLHEEIRQLGEWLAARSVKVTTIYFGGGTPTSIEAEEMDALYEVMYESFPFMKEVREVTVEAGRPDTITPSKIDVLKKYGIDRISVNPQSYTDETLKAIGRHHSVQETIDKFKLSRSMGMNNINMDLIIGLPNEGIEEFSHSLQETEKLQPESLTIHTLSFKRASEMTRNKKKYEVADRPTAEQMMKLGEQWTKANGYKPYYLYRQKNILGNLENVGYSKPEEESIYNIMIMEEVQTIIGIGCGASSKFRDPKSGRIKQFHNPKDPAAYILSYQESIEKKLELLNEIFPQPVSN